MDLQLKKFWFHLKYKNILKMGIRSWTNSMEFILEIICLRKRKDGPYVMKRDAYAGLGKHWIALYVKNI